MGNIAEILTDNLDIWTSAIERRSKAGRGRSKKFSLYGVEKLRALILDLAVRGKLVPQEQSDEAASELLKQIGREKAHLAKLKGIKAPKPLPPRYDPPFVLPRNWCWSQIAEVGVLSPRNDARDEIEASFVPMPMIPAEYGTPNKHEVRNWGDIKSGYTHFAEGDVGLAKITPCFENGKSTVFRNLTGGFGSGTTELHIVRPLLLEPDYILIFLKSPYFIETGIPKMTGTAGQKRIPSEYFAYAPFPLPPLAEQRRIVAKVDELMALCDALEAQAYDAIDAHELLVGNLLATLVRSQNAEELAENWARIETHFDILFTTEASIDQLKQAILQLAMMGKLVSQDPDDEPASALFKRVLQERMRQSKARRIRGDFIPETPSTSSLGGQLPDTWTLCALGQISIITDPNPSHRYPDYKNGTVPILSTQEFDGIDGWAPSTAKLTTTDFFEFQREHCDFEDGDIVFARKGRLGLPRFLPQLDRFTFSHTVFIIKPMPGVLPEFVLWFLRLDTTIDWLTNEMNKNVGVPTLGKAKTERLPLALPPFSEQKRIVAKIKEMLRVCDQLQKSLEEALTLEVAFAASVTSKVVD